MLALGIQAVEAGWVPDSLTRLAIRRLCLERLEELRGGKSGANGSAQADFIDSLSQSPIALSPEAANEQHYELPPEYFRYVLGPRRKYSCCYWPVGTNTLAAAEEAALTETCARAELADGQEILELGCGWGSLSLWMAERYPRGRVLAVSNSSSQREYIESLARARGVDNLQVVTADMNQFQPAVAGAADRRFDRVVSVEMFEHMRNYDKLLQRIASWLRPGGKLFVHIFCHREMAYPFQAEGADNWMGRYFFTGGLMPSADLLRRFDSALQVTQEWTWSGRHYQRTAEAWLRNLDAHRGELRAILADVYGRSQARRWLNRWRIFLLAGIEMFGYAGGDEWFVSHYLLEHAD